ncbi:hypothetical protein HOY82DRAFT_591515, partial [Tuber indicum]
MSSIFIAIIAILAFVFAASNTGVAEPTLIDSLLLHSPNNLPITDCNSACALITLPNEYGCSLFSKLCGAAVPDKSCINSGQLEMRVKLSGPDSHDTTIGCLCGPDGGWQETVRSEVSTEVTTQYNRSQKPTSTLQQAQTATSAPPKTSEDTKPDGTTTSAYPAGKFFLTPAAAAGISVATLITLAVLVGIGLLVWRRKVKRRDIEPDFDSVWDGQ